ncbi:glycosyltransferase [Halalkaliarchaeum sp. AArc-GB]|uniref:glycosyltransferase n=1 Tax=Halalkaliarchaeum sp. AArc-GB TaxID=3074078 RepID=UPI00285B9970|nr:glycosyltransferase [Halalkaliarchaeum sp. AArc-GB]MDR5674627.1 glycosyltransferase [Halalkaliarchaeum sp. AArc-GB]
MTDSGTEQLTVLMSPDYSDSNPYQSELIDALESHDVRVHPVDVVGAFPLLSGVRHHGVPDVLHLHWVHHFIIAERWGRPLFAVLLGVRLFLELVVLKLLGVRLVWTVHNLVNHEGHAPRTELVSRHVVARLVNRIVVHCESAAGTVRDRYRLPERVGDRIRVVPHGHFADAYRNEITQPEARRRLELPQGDPVLLYFGLIRPYKNVSELVETFRTVDGDARLLIVGNPWNEAIEHRVRRACKGDDRVEAVLEYVPDEHVQVYMRAADAVVLPFDSVLTSGSAVLGMTFGRAAIAPRLGCLPDLVGSDGGILYDPVDPDGLRSGLHRAMNDPEGLAAMGRRNRAAARQLDWNHIGKRTRTVYLQGSKLDVGDTKQASKEMAAP